MSLYRLDVIELYRRLDAQRISRGLMWRDLGRELRLSASTFSRMSEGKRPDVDAFLTMLVWLDLDVNYVLQPKEDQ